ncbi:MAG: 3' terminal RNA ribose 2'-O-methyltransferase Hen1, partial [Pseudomonadota bacterium]
MQIEITLCAAGGEDYGPRDLGFLLHKHPDRVHTRETSAGIATVFYPVLDKTRCTALLTRPTGSTARC